VRAINLAVVADRLRGTRELLQLTLGKVSQDTSIAHDRLEQIELAGAMPTGDEILILANYYARDFRDFIDESRPTPYAKTDILFRSNSTDLRADDRRAIQEFIYLCICEQELRELMKVESTSFLFRPSPHEMHKVHAVKAAAELRRALGYKSNEVGLDVYGDFRRLGVHVFRRRLSNPDISGLYINHPLAGHCVLVNFDEDIYRQRFSACHELGHSIFDSSSDPAISFQRTSARYDRKDLTEIRANVFASNFLLPPEILPKGQSWTEEAAVDWAKRLKVSTEALSYALLDAKIIDDLNAKRIRRYRVSGSQKIDPEAPAGLTDLQKGRRTELLERGLSDYYVGLCFEAHYSGAVTMGRLCELMLATHREVREISDTCSIWHMLSSDRFNNAAVRAGLKFLMTQAVLYECFQKQRSELSQEQKELHSRLLRERNRGRFELKTCSIEDLLAVTATAPMRLGAGELSCIAAAYRDGSVALMTDEKLARRHSEERLGLKVETTPKLYGYLHFKRHLNDSDHFSIVSEHERYERRPLTRFFNEAYEEALRCRLASGT